MTKNARTIKEVPTYNVSEHNNKMISRSRVTMMEICDEIIS